MFTKHLYKQHPHYPTLTSTRTIVTLSLSYCLQITYTKCTATDRDQLKTRIIKRFSTFPIKRKYTHPIHKTLAIDSHIYIYIYTYDQPHMYIYTNKTIKHRTHTHNTCALTTYDYITPTTGKSMFHQKSSDTITLVYIIHIERPSNLHT